MENEKKKCPLNGMEDCLADGCAWFDDDYYFKGCAVLSVAFCVRDIAEEFVPDIVNPIP